MKNNLQYFIILSVSTILLSILLKYLLNIDELVLNIYGDELTQKQINQLSESQNKWSWIIYIMTPLIILMRTSLVAICLRIGLFIYDIENKTKSKDIFRVALVGEFVLLAVVCSKLLYFYFIKTDYTLEVIQQFSPLSYTNFLDISKVEPWLIYPLQTINLFEIAYFFVLVYGLHKLLKNKYAKSFEIVAVSYGSGLAIWLGLVMFLTLNMS